MAAVIIRLLSLDYPGPMTTTDTTTSSTWERCGAGSLYTTKNNGRQTYQAKTTLRETTTGKRITVTGTGGTKKEATERLETNISKRMALLNATTLTPPQGRITRKREKKNTTPTLEEFMPIWLNSKGNTIKPQTRKTYETALTRWVTPYLTQPLKDLTREDLTRHFFYTLPETLDAGPYARHGAYRITNILLNDAVVLGYLETNPLRGTRVKRPKALAHSDDAKFIGKRSNILKNLLKQLSQPDHPHHEHYPLVLLMSLGLRRSEILGLEWDCLTNLRKPHQCRLYVRQQLIYTKTKGFFIQPETKSGSERNFILPEPVRLALLEKYNRRPETPAKYQWTSNMIFLNSAGLFTDYNRYREIWNRVLLDYMTKDGRELQPGDLWRAHTNRKIAASLLANSGVPMATAASILGHNAITMTGYYTQSSTDDKREGLEALANSLEL